MDATKKKPAPKNWACREYRTRMTISGAEKAMSNGCPKCGGVDVDLLESIVPPCAHEWRDGTVTARTVVCTKCGALARPRS